MGGGSSRWLAGNAALVMLTKHSLTHLSHIWHILVGDMASAAGGERNTIWQLFSGKLQGDSWLSIMALHCCFA